MYQKLHSLSPKAMENKHFLPAANYLFAEKEMVIEVLYAELSEAAASMPLGFIQQGEDFKLMGLLSATTGKNTYINAEGKWLSGYVPAVLRGYPFCAVPHPEDAEQAVICIDQPALVNASDDSKPLFNDQQQPSEDLSKIMEFWQQIGSDRKTTATAVASLNDAGIITPWALSVRINNQDQPVAGFFHIDTEKLNNLSGEQMCQLRDSGALQLAYAQILSKKRLNILEQVTAQYTNYKEKRRQLDEQLDTLFNGEQDLSFGF